MIFWIFLQIFLTLVHIFKEKPAQHDKTCLTKLYRAAKRVVSIFGMCDMIHLDISTY